MHCTRLAPSRWQPLSGRPQTSVSTAPVSYCTQHPSLICSAHPTDLPRRNVAIVGLLGGLLAIAPPRAQAKTKELPLEVYPKVDAIKRVMKFFLAENYDALEAITVDDALLRVQAPPQLPYSGRYEGKQCVRNFMAKFNTVFTITAVPEIFYYVQEAGSVFVALDAVLECAQDKSYGITTSMTMKLKVNDEGMLTKWSIISDTLAAYNVLQDVQAAQEYELQM